MKPILILGAGGFVGRQLVTALLQKNIPVRALVRDPEKVKALLPPQVDLRKGDLTEPATLQAAMEGCQAVYHLVAIEFERGETTFQRVHVEGTQHSIDAAKAAGITRFLYLGQISPGEKAPEIRFTFTKWQGEELLRQSGLAFTVFRASVIIGPGDHFIREMKKLSAWPIVPIAGSGATLLQPVSVWDVAAALTESLFKEETFSETLDLAGIAPISYAELARQTVASFGKKKVFWKIPTALLYVPAWVSSVTMKRPSLTPALLRLLQMPNTTEKNALPRLLTRAPMTLEEALQRTQELSIQETR
jgi:uncharacterized protein YbjT (DUF2867 family)